VALWQIGQVASPSLMALLARRSLASCPRPWRPECIAAWCRFWVCALGVFQSCRGMKSPDDGWATPIDRLSSVAQTQHARTMVASLSAVSQLLSRDAWASPPPLWDYIKPLMRNGRSLRGQD
jgi:hypothetical protein